MDVHFDPHRVSECGAASETTSYHPYAMEHTSLYSNPTSCLFFKTNEAFEDHTIPSFFPPKTVNFRQTEQSTKRRKNAGVGNKGWKNEGFLRVRTLAGARAQTISTYFQPGSLEMRACVFPVRRHGALGGARAGTVCRVAHMHTPAHVFDVDSMISCPPGPLPRANPPSKKASPPCPFFVQILTTPQVIQLHSLEHCK